MQAIRFISVYICKYVHFYLIFNCIYMYYLIVTKFCNLMLKKVKIKTKQKHVALH